MTETQKKLCGGLIQYPTGHGTRRDISKEEFLREFPTSLGAEGRLSLNLLKDAYQSQDADEVSCALVIGWTFGFGPEHKDILLRLADEDWHYSQEDVVDALDMFRTPDMVPALFRATQWIPKALEYDDARAMAVKAIWSLGRIPGTESEEKLMTLAQSDNAILRKNALEQLELRHSKS